MEEQRDQMMKLIVAPVEEYQGSAATEIGLEGKERQRKILVAKTTQWAAETEKALIPKSADLAEQRATAIAKVNAEYDRIQKGEFARLREVARLKREGGAPSFRRSLL